MPYDRNAAVAYAHQWAFKRNPAYMNFTGIGGDCTNFVSQCLHAGGAPMNYAPDIGWYYSSPQNRAAAWTGVEHLHHFLTGQRTQGPYAVPMRPELLLIGDIVQLSFRPDVFSHTVIIVATKGTDNLRDILVAAHTDDSDYRPLSTYWAIARRFLHIEVW